ncbi:MAG TPA: PssD/Cps14F family polysaccharide biosynthesis glycosyltransferase [Thermodesulfobacteriota bacterium]|nr:PssD/Cps14F family polysaccharide biosynthesis glycosyltransferase [Thermodesulfobacteriota bacterium]
MKIGIICSAGGHLTQALSVVETFQGHDCFLVLQNFPTVKNFNPPQFFKTYHLKILFNYGLGIKITPRQIIWLGVYITLLQNMVELARIFIKEKPDVLFSTGSEIAIPAFYIGKFLFRAKLIFLDSIARIEDISLTGKVLLPIVDLFLVQWEELARRHKKARFWGRVI